MKRKTERTWSSQPQLGLPFVQQTVTRDLSYYIGLCKVFAAYHKRWPTGSSTRAEFRAARIPHYDGRTINRELRFASPELAADPEYQALRDRCLVEGADDVDVNALDPRYRLILDGHDIVTLFETITLPRPAAPGEVRYATGISAHGPEELTLRLGERVRSQALRRAGLDPRDPGVLAGSFSVRVRVSDALKAIIERIGIHHPAAHERLADLYLLEAGDEGHLDIKYQLLAGSRYAGMYDVDHLVRKLASVYACAPDLERISSDMTRLPADLHVSATLPRQGDAVLREELAALVPASECLKLPIQRLSRFDDIRRLLEGAGGVYRTATQRFEFEKGTDAALILARLISGGVV